MHAAILGTDFCVQHQVDELQPDTRLGKPLSALLLRKAHDAYGIAQACTLQYSMDNMVQTFSVALSQHETR